MDNSFKVISPTQVTDNTFTLINDDWMLITAGTMEKYNMMTASWGGLGILWGRAVALCYVRPHRYTYEFMEKSEMFTLTFFAEEYRKMLQLCGSKSGRDIDKASASGLTPIQGTSGGIYYKEARLVLECKKIYFHDFDPEQFLDPSIQKNYPINDYHRMYIGEIKSCLVKE